MRSLVGETAIIFIMEDDGQFTEPLALMYLSAYAKWDVRTAVLISRSSSATMWLVWCGN